MHGFFIQTAIADIFLYLSIYFLELLKKFLGNFISNHKILSLIYCFQLKILLLKHEIYSWVWGSVSKLGDAWKGASCWVGLCGLALEPWSGEFEMLRSLFRVYGLKEPDAISPHALFCFWVIILPKVEGPWSLKCIYGPHAFFWLHFNIM